MADISVSAQKAQSEKALFEQFCLAHDLDWDMDTWPLDRRKAFKLAMRAHSDDWAPRIREAREARRAAK